MNITLSLIKSGDRFVDHLGQLFTVVSVDGDQVWIKVNNGRNATYNKDNIANLKPYIPPVIERDVHLYVRNTDGVISFSMGNGSGLSHLVLHPNGTWEQV